MLPIIHSPVLMTQSKIQPFSPMTLGKKRVFLLHYSLHTSFLQVTADGLGRDGMVLDILKGLGDLDSILSLSSTKESNSLVHISRRNDGWTTTSSFRKVETVFSANTTDGRVTESSGSRDLTSCLTQFQENNNLVDLISEKGFHDERSGKSDGVWLCLHHVELFIHHMTQC